MWRAQPYLLLGSVSKRAKRSICKDLNASFPLNFFLSLLPKEHLNIKRSYKSLVSGAELQRSEREMGTNLNLQPNDSHLLISV